MQPLQVTSNSYKKKSMIKNSCFLTLTQISPIMMKNLHTYIPKAQVWIELTTGLATSQIDPLLSPLFLKHLTITTTPSLLQI